MSELVPMKLKKKADKCTVMEPEAVSKTNNALLKAVVKTNVWKCQLEEGKHAKYETADNCSSYKHEMYTANYKVKLFIPQICRGHSKRETGSLRLADLREILMLWSEQLEKSYGLEPSITHTYYNRS